MTTITADQVADLADLAADLIERDGWTKQRWGGPKLGWCFWGAVWAARDSIAMQSHSISWGQYRGMKFDNLAAERLKDLAEPHVGTRNLANWNDWHAGSAFEVIDLLRHIAKDARNQEREATHG